MNEPQIRANPSKLNPKKDATKKKLKKKRQLPVTSIERKRKAKRKREAKTQLQ